MRFHRHKMYEALHTHARADHAHPRVGKARRWHALFVDLCLGLLFLALLVGFIAYGKEFFSPYQENREIDLCFCHLPKYAFFSFSRACLAYCVSFVFSLLWGFWAAKDRIVEKIIIPLLDVLQSIPILGFMPGLVLLMTSLFPTTNVGVELAAVLLMFTSQAWNMAFGVYQSVSTVPYEKQECAKLYGFNRWQRTRYVEIPCATTSLVFNSLMSVAGGWFFLMVNEAFQLGSRDFRIPGLGSYMSSAANQGNVSAMIAAVVTMIILIILLDQLVWRPLIVWSQKFRIEDVAPTLMANSWFLNSLNKSALIALFKTRIHRARSRQEKKFMPKLIQKKKTDRGPILMFLSRGALVFLSAFLVWALFSLIRIMGNIPLSYWLHLGHMIGLTLLRVIVCLIISGAIALPLGLFIGLSEKNFRVFQPIFQVMASFPMSLLFPAALFVMAYFHIPSGINSTILMLMGTQWYILFNVIAGARAMPSDLKEVATGFAFPYKKRFLWLYLPSIFPYLITGLVTASGGAWNTSIIAEYASFKGHVMITEGIGSAISQAAQNNEISLLIADVLAMVLVVGLINYLGWLRLYKYSEKHFALNY